MACAWLCIFVLISINALEQLWKLCCSLMRTGVCLCTQDCCVSCCGYGFASTWTGDGLGAAFGVDVVEGSWSWRWPNKEVC